MKELTDVRWVRYVGYEIADELAEADFCWK